MSAHLFARRLDALLQPLGFARRNKTWNRKRGTMIHVIDLQVSKAGDGVTINVGVLDPEVHTIFWGDDPADFVQQPTCTVTARIGELADGHDIWWSVTERDAASDATDRTTDYVLPFLEQMRSRAAMRDWLAHPRFKKAGYPPPLINLAVIQICEGDTVAGLSLMKELESKTTEAWRAKIAEIEARSGASARLHAPAELDLN